MSFNFTTDVKNELDQLERKFLRLQHRIEYELIEKKESVNSISTWLRALPCKLMNRHYDYVKSITEGNILFKNVRDMILELRCYCWNFLEYKVLQELTHNVGCSEELTQDIDSYANDVDDFKRRTTFSDFMKCCTDDYSLQRLSTTPPQFVNFKTKHKIRKQNCNLYVLDKMRQKSCHKLGLSEFALQVHRAKDGCIEVEWLVPEEEKHRLVTFVNSVPGRELLAQFQVVRTLIDDRLIYSVFILTVTYINSCTGIIAP